MKRCTCRSCRDRDMRRFWRTIGRSYSIRQWTRLTREANETTRPATMFPPIPQWEGAPQELTLRRRT